MAKKILLADDSITIQKVVELTFSDGDYEVTAVNNGAKAIQKLSEMRPDIILSDIIMPEKNGYEVCEYVKSHPEYRNIPVILLTGTFEPFDPDRADKAGCDAVVTKPFESQSLIHKVEELIQQSQNAPAAEPEPAPMFDDAPRVPADPFTHDNDIFNAAPAAAPSYASDMPFDAPSEPAFGGETRAFPRMSFEEMQQMANEPAEPPTAPQPAMPEPVHEPETSPWDETPAAFGGETRAFPRMSFEEMEQMASASQPSVNETPAFHEPPPPPLAPESSPWDEPQDDASTRAIPKMSFEEMRKMAEAAQPSEPPPFETLGAPAEPEASPWDEAPPAFGGETRAFPRMSFEEMEQMAASSSSSSELAWAPPTDPFAEAAPAESPFAVEETPEATADTAVNSQITDDVNSQITDDVNSQITDDVNPQITDLATDLTEEQVDRIARRVVQLMSEQVVRNIAWEVIPDLAEMVVKERIRQLEAEA
ncbi:MAG TPA: response regulator [Thermoanaerobaculia bacterium]|jgi:CheY-like chemotaxis protein|nr:response regulator [Thermoanaerobaculia bacterium]